MANFNKVILMGNLTRDPEMRVMPNGNSITKFGLAVNRNFTDKSGERRQEVLFVDVDCFGRQAEVINEHFHRGKAILVEGRLKLDQWETQGGEKRSKIGVVLESFGFVGSKDDGEQQQSSSQRQSGVPASKSKGTQAELPDFGGDDADVPF